MIGKRKSGTMDNSRVNNDLEALSLRSKSRNDGTRKKKQVVTMSTKMKRIYVLWCSLSFVVCLQMLDCPIKCHQ